MGEKNDANASEKSVLERISTAMSLGLKAASVLLLVFAFAVLARSSWREAHEIQISPLTISDDMTKRGVSGESLSQILRDTLTAMEQASEKPDAGSRIQVISPNEPAKLSVSESGFSVSDISGFLADIFASKQRVTGAVSSDAGRFAIVLRVSEGNSAPCTRQGTTIESASRQAAICLYEKLDPFRFAAYARKLGRTKQALLVYERLARNGDGADRAWALRELGSMRRALFDDRGALRDLRLALKLKPLFALAYRDKIDVETDLGRWPQANKDVRKLLTLLRMHLPTDVTRPTQRLLYGEYASNEAEYLGDYLTAAASSMAAANLKNAETWYVQMKLEDAAADLAAAHDANSLLRVLQNLASLPQLPDTQAIIRIASNAQDWELIRSVANRLFEECGQPWFKCVDDIVSRYGSETSLRMALAYSEPVMGSNTTRAAEAIRNDLVKAAGRQTGCYSCMVIGSRVIAASRLKANKARAEQQLRIAIERGPGLPFAYLELGRLLLVENRTAEAKTLLNRAASLAPTFADPLVLLTEASARGCDFVAAKGYLKEALERAPEWDVLVGLSHSIDRAASQRTRSLQCSWHSGGATTRKRHQDSDRLSRRELRSISLEADGEQELSKVENEQAAQSTGTGAEARREILQKAMSEFRAASQTEIRANVNSSPHLLFRMARLESEMGYPANDVSNTVRQAMDEYKAEDHAAAYWSNPRVDAELAMVFWNDVEKIEHRMMLHGDWKAASDILESVTEYIVPESTLNEAKGEVLEHAGNLEPAFQAYMTSWRMDTGDRSTKSTLLLERAVSLAIHAASNGCFNRAEQVIVNTITEEEPEWPAIDATDRARALELWAFLLTMEGRDEEAAEKLNLVHQISLSPAEKELVSSANAHDWSASSQGERKACATTPFDP